MTTEEIVTAAKGVFKGTMGEASPAIVLFNSPATGSTYALPVHGLTVDAVRQHLAKQDARWESANEMETRRS